MDQKCGLAREKNFSVPCEGLLAWDDEIAKLHSLSVLVHVGLPTASVRTHGASDNGATTGRGRWEQRCRPTLKKLPDAWCQAGPHCLGPVGVELVDLAESKDFLDGSPAPAGNRLVRQVPLRSARCCPFLEGHRVDQRERVDLEVHFKLEDPHQRVDGQRCVDGKRDCDTVPGQKLSRERVTKGGPGATKSSTSATFFREPGSTEVVRSRRFAACT